MTVWRSFNIRFPSDLESLYNELQGGLDYLLSDPEARAVVESVDYSQHKGKVWIELRDKLPRFVQNLNVKNKAWYARMIFENVRREVQSKRENITIYNELEKNENRIDSTLYSTLVTQHKIYATRGRITNILKAGRPPELPRHAVFQLDYTVSANQNFTMDSDNKCRIQTDCGKWIDYQILLPVSLNGNVTGRVAKPRFMKRKSDGKFIGICSYEYTPESPNGDSVLGVDLGKIKLFSAVALDSNGKHGSEYVHSTRTEQLRDKLARLYESRRSLYSKLDRCGVHVNLSEVKQARRDSERKEITRKITRLKTVIARVVAREVLTVARVEGCGEIHIENLSWLGSQGGKWAHSMTQGFITEAAIASGVKVVKGSPAGSSSVHPVTNETGTANGRLVKFSDGQLVDRDKLAAVNLAVRGKGCKKRNKIVSLRKGRATPKRVVVRPSKTKQEIKEIVKQFKGGTQVVVFSPSVSATGEPVVVPWSPAGVNANCSLLARGTPHVSISDNN